jgi:hypothetical protein
VFVVQNSINPEVIMFCLPAFPLDAVAAEPNISSFPSDAVDMESNVGGILSFNEARNFIESSILLPSDGVAAESIVGGVVAAESSVLAAPDSSTVSIGVAVESNVGGVPAAESSVLATPNSSTALPSDGVDTEPN